MATHVPAGVLRVRKEVFREVHGQEELDDEHIALSLRFKLLQKRARQPPGNFPPDGAQYRDGSDPLQGAG